MVPLRNQRHKHRRKPRGRMMRVALNSSKDATTIESQLSCQRTNARKMRRVGEPKGFSSRPRHRRDYSSPIVTFLSFCSRGCMIALCWWSLHSTHRTLSIPIEVKRGPNCEKTEAGFPIQIDRLDCGLYLGAPNGARAAADGSHASARSRRGYAVCALSRQQGRHISCLHGHSRWQP